MTFFEMLLAIVGAVLIGLVFYFLFRVSGPWGSLWTFLIVLILVALAAEIWITPVGPEYQGFAWIPTLFVVLIFAILLAAASPPRKEPKATEVDKTGMDESVVALSAFFWIFLLFLLIAVLIGIWV